MTNERTVLTNDFTAGTAFSSISFSGIGSETANGYSIVGNSLEITSSISKANIAADLVVNSMISVVSGGLSGDKYYSASTSLTGDVSGTGGFTVSNDAGSTSGLNLSGNNTFSGNIVVNSGGLSAFNVDTALGSTVGSTTINDGANLSVTTGASSWTTAEDFIFNGSEMTGSYRGSKMFMSIGYGPTGPVSSTTTFNGTFTINSDTTIWSYGQNVTISDFVSNGNTLSRAAGAYGTLTTNSTQVLAPYYEQTFTDNSAATSVLIGNHERTVINGTRGDITVSYDGILSGTGTVGNVTVGDGGVVAAGASPGCLSSGNYDQNGGVFEVEVDGSTVCTQYDQLGVTGTVDVDPGTTLNLIWDTNYTPTAGDTFVIIDNDGADAVTGNFNGLAEGANITEGEIVLSISYAGGDGNDVVLTVDSVPATPDTGFSFGTSSYTLVGVSTLIATTLIGGIGYKFSREG